MWNEQMVCVTAWPLNSNHARRHAKVIQTFMTPWASATPCPRINKALCADGSTAGIGSRGDDGTKGLVTERRGQLHAPFGHQQTLAAAEFKITVADMHVAVADATVF